MSDSFEKFKTDNKEYFDVEKMSIPYFDEFYKDCRCKVLKRLKGRENKKRDVEILDIETNTVHKIEEKADSYFYPLAPIEIIQNIPHPEINHLSMGNFYTTHADKIMHMYFQNSKPYRMYKLDKRKILQNMYLFFKDKAVELKYSTKGWGITILMGIDWDYLIETGCVELVKEWNKEDLF